MAFQPEVLHVTQYGLESVPGTQVSADRKFHSLTFDIDPKKPTTEVRQAGNKFPVNVVPGKGKTEGSFKGDAAASDLIDLFATCLETPTYALVGTLANTATFTPASSGTNTLKSVTLEKGVAGSGLAMKFGYVRVTEWELDFTPDKQVAFSGKVLGQGVTTGATLTSSPTTNTSNILFPTEVDVYLATSEAGLAAAQVKPLSAKVKMSKIFGDVYVLSSAAADASFTEMVEVMPDLSVDLVFPKSAATDTLLASIDANTLYYLEIIARGAFIETDEDDFYHQLRLRMPIKFTNPGEGSAQDVHTATFTATAIDDPTFNSAAGGALLVEITSTDTAL